ncbi:MAG: FMN-binding protein [Xanthomonadales bacterium]|nr:FMN-binding protein [Xanthomonadales bacterium]
MTERFARPRETLKRTLGFAFVVAFACALLVSTVVHYLRPIQRALASMDQTRAIVSAAGWHAGVDEMSDLEVANAFRSFEVRLADLQSGAFIAHPDPAALDFRASLQDSPRERPQHMPVYLRYHDGRLVRVVLPIRGRGMWSTIYGLLALDGDLVTVAGLVIFEHGETPGIGDRIEDEGWLGSWRGTRLYDAEGNYRLTVDPRPRPEDAAFAIDAITGATITVTAVENAVSDWLGATGYGPLLATLGENTP